MELRLLVLPVLFGVCGYCGCQKLEFSQREPLSTCVDECASVTLSLRGNGAKPNRTFVLRIEFLWNLTVAKATPLTLLANGTPWSVPVEVCGMFGGYTTIVAEIRYTSISAYLPVIVSKKRIYKVMSDVFCWIYLLAWSISYYPQIYTNYSRKSVVGLSLDFVFLDHLGFSLYLMFNCGMYFGRSIQEQYFKQYPKGVNPVRSDNLFFSLHAFIATSLLMYQFSCYERDLQQVSRRTLIVVALFYIILLTKGYDVSTCMSDRTWLEFLLACSRIKVIFTMFKYIPQAFMNYSRKSTVGWSIEYVVLDFVGNVFSMLQMDIDTYNYNNCDGIFEDPKKLIAALTSTLCDLFLMYQHCSLYRNPARLKKKIAKTFKLKCSP